MLLALKESGLKRSWSILQLHLEEINQINCRSTSSDFMILLSHLSSPIEYIKNQKNKKKENKLKGCKSNQRLCHVPNLTAAVVMLQRSPFSKEI
jgi:hypothetical protein